MYKPNVYPYFDKLVVINNSLFDYVIDYNIRSEEFISFIEEKICYLEHLNSLNEEKLLNTIAAILCLQPFYDGNSRTLKLYLKYYLKRFEKELTDISNPIIPVFYSIEDKCSKRDIDILKKHIK